MNETELVHSYLLNCDRLSLYLNKDKPLKRSDSLRLAAILKRRISGEPLQYILGRSEFMGLEFKVDRRALIPRPETEILVLNVLERLGVPGNASVKKVLDLGTGSGCIAVSLAKFMDHAEVMATDISCEALSLAGENAALHQVKVRFMLSDIFGALKEGFDKFDLIVSNPPYIRRRDLQGLCREISFEPEAALSAGDDGLDFYRRIIADASCFLAKGGVLAFEAGAGQAAAVRKMLLAQKFDALETIKDYNGIERVVIAKRGIF